MTAHDARIRVAVNGYGVIGKRVADAVALQDDMALVGVAEDAFSAKSPPGRGFLDGYEVQDWLRGEALVSQQAAASLPAPSKASEAPEAPEARKTAAKRAPAAAPAKTPAAPSAVKVPAAKRPAVAAKRAPAKPRGE